RNLVPNNIFQATFQQTYTDYVEHNGTLKRVLKQRDGTATLGIIFFCIVFGAILGTLGPKKKTVLEFFQTVYTIMLKILLIAIWMTPIGVCSVITSKLISIEDMTVTMRQLSKFVATSIGGFLVYHLIVIQLIYFLFTRKNPYKYYVNFFPAILTAFATSSKSAALPITFQVMDEKVKMSQQVTRFVLPIGNSIHMTGLAQFIPICVIFIAQMRGMDVTLGLTMNIWMTPIGVCSVITSKLISIEDMTVTMRQLSKFVATSIGGFLVYHLIVIQLIYFLFTRKNPYKYYVNFFPAILTAFPMMECLHIILFAVDWLVDRVRTTVNLMGDCYAVAVVDHLSRHELQDSVDDYDEEAQKTSDL
ncbi:excitatory amino acid transporter-like, partial [Diaphorina citri]|uniref:Amino acid transporter n=1 Tax=Diaphorina citri TaxID=121845 RepID=A0A1S4E711_DIACI